MIHVIDADDAREDHTGLRIWEDLAAIYPGFRVTLFTIPALTMPSTLEGLASRPFIELAAHGWDHHSSRECQHWDRARCEEYLDVIEEEFPLLAGGFKAPGWQISDPMYEALLARDWWVADQAYNDARRPPELRAYTLDPEPGICKHHFHLGHLGGHNINALEDRAWLLYDLPRDHEFRFVSEVVRRG